MDDVVVVACDFMTMAMGHEWIFLLSFFISRGRGTIETICCPVSVSPFSFIATPKIDIFKRTHFTTDLYAMLPE